MRIWIVAGRVTPGWWLMASLDVAVAPKVACIVAVVGLYPAGQTVGFPLVKNGWLIHKTCVCGNC